MQFRKKDLLGIKQLEPEEIELILETAETFKELVKSVFRPALLTVEWSCLMEA